MNLDEKESFSLESSEDDFLIRKIVLTHDPDGRYLDSELLLQAVENVLCSAATADPSFQVSDLYNDGAIVEVVGSEESLEHIIYKISLEMLVRCSADSNLHTKTMVLLHMLGKYSWDAKVVLILASLATSCGECWLIKQSYPYNHLAASAGLHKQYPSDLNMLRIQFKALRMLANTMVELAKCFIKFEKLPMKEALLDYEAMALTKTQIYIATYRIFKGSLEFSAQTIDFIAMNQEKISQTTAIAAWELSYMVPRLRRLCNDLIKQVDLCHDQIGGSEPRLLDDAAKQLSTLPFYHSFWNRSTKPTLDLTKELLEIFTATKMAKVFFTNSGSETNDTQVLLLP
ncbi:hypothetical protein POM88_013210 [Heracleum sosnowskyi]|uniref:Sieve element occlusion N-terminal domain-containing protein n=1 Tax=Heracleum sosnowskyi TaxID=360622 RepID=A0AAD8IZJ8_9APIA|nr:hypothetical protein POM88_013210 [Heracleum sosnowskyi]